MYRQGDVLLVRCDREPTETAVRVPRAGGHLVLALGEVTGHAHAVASPLAELLEERDGRRYLRVLAGPEPVELVHEEHAGIALPPGVYEVVHQREYSPGAVGRIRAVWD